MKSPRNEKRIGNKYTTPSTLVKLVLFTKDFRILSGTIYLLALCKCGHKDSYNICSQYHNLHPFDKTPSKRCCPWVGPLVDRWLKRTIWNEFHVVVRSTWDLKNFQNETFAVVFNFIDGTDVSDLVENCFNLLASEYKKKSDWTLEKNVSRRIHTIVPFVE